MVGVVVKPTTETFKSPLGVADTIRITWAGMAKDDTGEPFAAPSWMKRDVQVVGVLGVGGKVLMQGSNFGTPPLQPGWPSADAQYGTIHDTDGDAAEFAAAGFARLLEAPIWTRPYISAGDVDTLFTVIMVVRP